ncbi:hypothetical protein [Nocardioides pocheonensis]|uniref:Fibronectin type-III domain-containing protein n=1 Tax=Nocardioides pocheonensis TaxID=661485 RepID=A0A3N0GUX1_9ACTN|nr:hypothetical protein [Nocardioides pocheonensis]RNM15930.1 hypothetical protein EFL26_07115 [Nocardioides pocheonensis]
MHKRIVLALVGLVVLAGLSAPGAGAAAAGDPSSGPSSTLQPASNLRPTHGGGASMGHGYLPLHARAFAQAKAAANRRAGVGGGSAQAASTAPVVTTYPNVSPSFAGTYQSGLTPPDTTGAIGPDRYIETVNTSYAIYNRSGSVLNSGSLSALTAVPGGLFGYSLSDPQMMWDATTQRFYYVALYYDSLSMTDNGLAVGWSKTATPASSADFCQYTLSFGTDFPDYPKLGDSKDFLIFGYNDFTSAGSTYTGSWFASLNKPPAGTTCASAGLFAVHYSGVLHNADGSLAATPVPANLVDNAAGTGYVVANADLTVAPSADYVTTYTVTTNGTDANGIPVPAFGAPRSVAVPTYRIPANASQQGSSYLLDTLDGRFEAAVAAVDPDHGNAVALWTAHAVYGGAGAEERWYEVDPAAGSLLQSGVAGSASLFAWNGAISPDRADDGSTGSHGNSMAMSVSTSSASTFPAIQFVSKSGSGAQSALSNLVQAGGANVDFSCSSTAPCRWGDYSAASPDPAAGGGSVGRVWLGNQYDLAGGSTSTTSWRTWLFAVTPSAPATAALSFATAPQTLVAGASSAPMRIGVSAAQPGPVQVTLGSSSSGGQFAPVGGAWTSTLVLTIPAGATVTPDFSYRDTRAGTPTLSASAVGLTGATQAETVTAAPLSTLTVSPSGATLALGGSQLFTASGSDQFGNPVGVSSATWTTTAPGTLSPSTGASTTFTASSSTTGSGSVTATLGSVHGAATVTVTATAPPAPTNLVAAARGKRVTLSWSGSGATYNIYRGSTSGGETLYRSGVSGTTTTDSSVTSGTWYYRVTAVGPGGESAPSNEASVRVK